MAVPLTADLHTHTSFSDGTETPDRVIELAMQAGLSAIAITDHDTLEGLPQAEAAARQHGVELIPGIEMSASMDAIEVHLLGYWLNAAHPGLQQHLSEQQARRMNRAREMVTRLQRMGLQVTAEEVFALAGEGTVGRPHVARALLNRGYVSTMAEAFERYLGPKGPAFVPGSPLPPSRILQVIREASGVPVLAHPVYLKDDTLIDGLVEQGLAGLEVYHSSHTPELIQRYEQIAKRLHLLATGGSDYHGNAKEGAAIGAVKVPYALVEGLKQWVVARR